MLNPTLLLSPYRGLPKEIYVIFVSRVINALGSFVMPLMTIILTQSVGLSKEIAGLYISGAGLLFLPASLLGGKLADGLGRKKVIAVFDGLAAVFYILAGFTTPSMQTVYLMMLAGVSMMAAGPAHDSLLADLTTPESRSGAYALSYMGWNMGFALGPVLGGVLYKNHLPLVFWGDALTALIGLSLVLLFVPETFRRAQTEVYGEERKLEQRVSGSIWSVLKQRKILIYFAFIVFGYNFAYAQSTFMLPMQVLEIYPEVGARYFGFLAGCNGLVVLLFTPVLTRLVEKTKSIRRMVYGGLLYALGFGMLGAVHTLSYFFLATFIFTLGEIILAISTAPFIANHTPASHRGRMSAVIPMIFGLGNTLGPAGMGKMLAYVSIENAWLMIGLSTLLFAVLMYRLEKWEASQITNRMV